MVRRKKNSGDKITETGTSETGKNCTDPTASVNKPSSGQSSCRATTLDEELDAIFRIVKLKTGRELQALNEELVTVNAELQEKVEALNRATSDMENLLSSSGIATLFLDRGLHIKGFTPVVAEIFNLIPADIGRPFQHLAGRIDWPTLAQDAETVLAGQPFVEREVAILDRERSYLKRISPYRDREGRIDGVVVTFIDITERKRAEEQTVHLASFPQLNPNPVLEVDLSGNVTFFNPATQKVLENLGKLGADAALFLPADLDGILESWDRKSESALYREIAVREKIFGETIFLTPQFDVARIYAFDITWQKRAQEALAESERRVRRKLDSIIAPDGDIVDLDLADIIDTPALQALMDDFYELTGMTMGLLDLEGKVQVGVGWQAICTQYHRVNPETCKNCIESDLQLSAGVPHGEYKIYKCRNNMWDVATPVVVGDRHFGNLFMGQFFFEDEPLDYELFRSQAREYGFDEKEYIAALEAVPRLSRETLNTGMDFFMKLADMLSRMSYSNLKLARSLEERARAEEKLRVQARTLKALNSGNRALLHATDELSLLQAVCRTVVEDCGHTMVWIGFAEEDEEKSVRPVASSGFEEGYLETLGISWADTERGRGPTGTAIRTGKQCGCVDMLSDPAFEPWRNEAIMRGYASSLVLPLMDDGRAFGALSIYSPKPNAFSAEEADLLMQLADELAYGISTVRLRVTHDRTDEELRRSKDEWERTFNSVPDLIAIIDDRHRVVRVNRAMAERLGREPEECLGMPCYEAVHGSDLPPDFCPHSRTMEDGGEHNLELHGERLGGDYLVTTTPLLDREGRMTGTVHVARDITERKRAEVALKRAYEEMEKRVEERTAELRDKDQMLLLQNRQAAMGEMIGNIAHQWRQPLNFLGLTIQQLPLYYDLGKINKELLNQCVSSSMEVIQHMSRTIDDFRNYFRPDKEKIEFNVHDAIVNALSLLEGTLQNPRINITIVAKNDPVIYGYQNEFSQVLLNILMNARDALLEKNIADPGVTIMICSEKGCTVVTIADNAGGIPEDIINKIFDPYFTTKGPQQGTGVGLFMSKTIIEKNMGGILSARNSADGAEFRIEVSNEITI